MTPEVPDVPDVPDVPLEPLGLGRSTPVPELPELPPLLPSASTIAFPPHAPAIDAAVALATKRVMRRRACARELMRSPRAGCVPRAIPA